jgi:galactokinase
VSKWSLDNLQDRQQVAERLRAEGLREEPATEKAALFARVAQQMLVRGASENAPVTAHFVPGRIEVLGKHTDYAGGRSILATVERGFCTLAIPRGDAEVRVLDAALGEVTSFPLDSDIVPPLGHWSNYPMTVARRVARNFPKSLRGADIGFVSDLPQDAGMSSSSAMVVATFFALDAVNMFSASDAYTRNITGLEDLAGYLGTIENGLSYGSLEGDRGVGTFGGSEDHTAMLCARSGKLVQYAYCPVRHERTIPLAEDHSFVIAVSGVVADKTGSALEKYNRVSQRARIAIEIWRQATGRDDPHLAAAVASSPDAQSRFLELLRGSVHPQFASASLVDRLEHFLAENESIIPAVAERIDAAHVPEFGELVDRSQTLGARLLGNQTPETEWLAKEARALGAVAASAFGAGFGGSVWALTAAARAEGLREAWSAEYRRAFPERASRAEFFITGAGPAALRL